MSQLSKLLRDVEGGQLMFWCPGCNCPHGVAHGTGPGLRWTWNGDVDKPSFQPSIVVQYTYGEDHTKVVCHSFVIDGRIEFLNDCTHSLAGQTVDLPAWKDE